MGSASLSSLGINRFVAKQPPSPSGPPRLRRILVSACCHVPIVHARRRTAVCSVPLQSVPQSEGLSFEERCQKKSIIIEATKAPKKHVARKLQPERSTTEATHAGNYESGPSFPVVGVGGSAGGLKAFTALLKALPADTGMAFVLIQHMDPNHQSVLTSLLRKSTVMSV
jgi:chemotaxis response regulator CheB